MTTKFLVVNGLKECIDRQNAIEAKDLLESISKFFDDILSKAELEHALEVLFNTQTGTIGFLNRSIKERKLFKDCNAIIFDLWIKIIQNHGTEVNFEAYVQDVIECCMKFIISSMVSAKEKEKSAVVLQEVFQNKLIENFNASELVSKLLEVFNIKTHPETFLQQVFKLLGIISRDSPEDVIGPNAVRVRDCYLKTLEDILLNEETVKFRALTGAMNGLDLYLINFAPSPNEEADICDRIYTCIKKLSDPPQDTRQKAMFRAALDVFTHHATIFAEKIFKDFKYWHTCFLKWTSSSIYEDRKKGIYAVHAFHEIIANELFKRKDSNDEAIVNILRFLMNFFRSILESPSSRSYETRIAIRGFGLMAGSCKVLLDSKYVMDLLSLVIQRTELISLAEDNELRDNLEHFPDYIQALSQMILQITDKHIVQILSLNIQNIIVRLIKDFHYLSRAHTGLVVNSLSNALYNLSTVDGNLFNEIMERIIFQGVIWTCSHKLVYDAALDWGTNIDWKDNITYKNYMPLWEGLLDESGSLSYDKPQIARNIFNHLMTTLFLILEKLNLRTKRRIFSDDSGKDQEFFFCDSNIDLCPEKPKDFHIFFNMVDFYRDIFWSKYRRENFREWANEYCSKIMENAVKNPLVSGFLKLLEVGLVAADYLGHFQDNILQETKLLQIELSYFLKSLIKKCQKMSGELQISCLELILKCPIHLYRDYIQDLIPIFKIALDLGKSIIWLAKLAVDSLEKISDIFQENSSDIKTFYKYVLPSLDTYMQSKGFTEDLRAEIVRYKNKKRIRKAKLENITETDLLIVQRKIFSFLGKLDPHNAALVVSKDFKEGLVKWDVTQNISLTLYLPDMKPEIFLDTIVPRICHLAVTSSDRKTKIAACELVHAVILYLLGTRNHKGQIWKELCLRMLILGADGDATVQEMFEPLLMQIMHFMSKYENLNRGVDTLLEILMEGISNNSNCSVRDLSARCLREFVEWSVKQTTPEQLAASPASIEIILKQLKMFSFDSNAEKRSGAALAFNNLYRKLREEESICDRFFVDLLHTFCVNFKLSEELSSAPVGTLNSDLEQVSQSLDHVVRVLKERNYLFNKSSSRRLLPSIFEVGTLKEIVIFLVKESGSKLMNYRHKCIEMVEALAPRVEDITSFSMFLRIFITKDILMETCEGHPNGSGIKARPNLSYIKNSSTIPHLQIYLWLEHFLSSLDCYCWLLGDYALGNPEILFENASIFQTVSYYLNNICWNSMYEIIEKINSDFLSETSDTILKIGTEEMNKIESIKCIIIVRLIDFVSKALQAGCGSKFPENFWTDNKQILFKFITQVIYEPHHLDFDFKSEEVARKLPARLECLLKQLNLNCPDKEFVKELKSEMMRVLCIRLKEITDSAQEILSSDLISQRQQNSVRGIEFSCRNLKIMSTGEISEMFLMASADKLISDLFYGLKQKVFDKFTTINLPPDVKKFGNKLLKICLLIKDLTKEVVNYILNESELFVNGTTTLIKHGEHFFNTYKRTIFEQCNSSFLDLTFRALFTKISETNCYYVLKISIEITEYTYKYKSHDRQIIEKLVDIILENLSEILKLFIEPNKDVLFIELMSTLALANPYPVTTFKAKAPVLEEWILFRLRYQQNSLEQKSRIITLLPLLVGPDDIKYDALTQALEEVQRQHFPLKSKEFAKNSLEETGLKSAFNALLTSLINSKSYVILDFVIKSTAPDPDHILEWMIKDEVRVFVANLNNNQQLDCLTSVFEIVCNDGYEPNIRRTVLERFVLIILQSCTEDSLVKFYTTHIKRIQTLTECNFGFDKSGWAVEHALINRIIGFSLIEMMSGCLPKEKLLGKECPIATAMVGQLKNENEFVAVLTRKSFYARVDVFVTDDKSAAEFFRLYQCAAYRAVCSLVSNTQNRLNFFTKLIFEENSTKNEFIWRKLIDCNDDKKYIFQGQEFEDFPKIKERFVSIRKLNPRPFASNSYLTTSKHLQTQNIFNSSLSQDVSKIDLNYTFVRNDAEVQVIKERQAREILSVNLERNDLNKHEVMSTLCGVIQHMYENKIFLVSEDPNNQRKHEWLIAIAKVMKNPENHRNIRLFLAQLVDNCRNVFQYYASIVFEPILEVLVDECAGSELNFFITDLTALLLSWTSKNIYKPSSSTEVRLASNLLKILMKNAWHEKKEIFKFNLELIQTMISLWKDIISVPNQLLLDMITQTQRTNSRSNECGIILVALMLTHDLIPWTESTKINFIRAIFANLNNDYSSVYQSAAQVMGLILGKLKSLNDNENLETLQSELVVKLKSLSNKKEKVFMDILFGIQKNYPEILNFFKELISFKLPGSIGAIKRIYLEMFLTCLDSYKEDGIYDVMLSIGIKDLLKNTEYQLLALHILNKALSNMEEKDIKNIFSTLETCLESRKSECRDITYEILIFINLNFSGQLSHDAGVLLLKGLNDAESQIQNRIYQFWSQEAELPIKTADRITCLISDYSINCEKQFLGFCTQLILEPAVTNSESKQQIFPFETDTDAKLIEYNINTNYKIKSSFSLPPLFAESQQVKHSLLTGSQVSNFVRETAAEYVFEPTQDPTKMAHTRQNFSLPSQSSLAFSIQPQVLDRRSQKIQIQQRTEATDDMDKSLNNFRKRFLKDKDKEKRETVLKVIDFKTRQRDRMVSEIKKKEGQVVLYRRYRFGDYPDLLINRLALLLPLQGLVKRDSVIARQVFVSVFDAILEELGPERKMFIISVGSKIQTILENCKTCEPTIFATFLEIALMKSQHFNFAPETVAMLSKATKMLTIGALYLENRLDVDWETERMSSKSSSTVSPDEKHWLCLSDIYNALADYDIVSSIFSDKLGTDPRLAEAIELKTNRKYEEAQTRLLEVIKSPFLVGTDYAYNCYYECICELADWRYLSQEIQSQIDDFEDLWTDEFNTTYLLPKLIQAELQTILEGNSRSKDFLRVLELWMADPNKADHIKTTFCEELMMLSIADKEFLQARVFGENYMKTFLAEWGVVNSLYNKLRLENLLNAQKVAEIDRYALLLIENFNETSVEKLKNQWSSCTIEPSESLKFWNCVIAYRTFTAALIIDAMGNLEDGTITTGFRNTLFDMDLEFFNAAIYQKNYGLADKILNRLSPLQNLQFEIARIKRTMLDGQRNKSLTAISFMEQAWRNCANILQDENLQKSLDMNIEVFNLYGQIVEEIFLLSTECDLNNERKKDLMELADKSRSRNFHQKIFEQSLWAFQESTHLADSIGNDSDLTVKESKRVANSYFRLAQFCYDYHDNANLKKSQNLEKILLKAVFQAMKYGSKEARQLFPCVLQLPSVESGDLQECFQSDSCDVPEWMFLTWLPQILSRLEYSNSCYLDGIVMRIAQVYPNALIYPFIMWYDRFKNDAPDEEMVRVEIGQIKELLKNQVIERFIENLKTLCVPESLLITHIDALIKRIKNWESITQKDYERQFDILLNAVFQLDTATQGSAFRRIEKFQSVLKELKLIRFGSNKEKVFKKLYKLQTVLREAMNSIKRDDLISLDTICPWLAQFQWCGEEDFLELPGQYSGTKRPNMQEHIKVVKFGQRMQMFKSLRCPLKLSIFGSNGKTYDFLVKYGEDLKQDQRIQQIFELMSEKLAEDQNCRNHNLYIRTFKVIPIEQRGGMISWVTDTIELEKFITNYLSRRETTNDLGVINVKYYDFIKKASRDMPNVDDMTIYGKAASTYTIEEIVANFRNMESSINLDILKYALIDISVSPESYFVLRNNFATSLAVMSVAHWILGIGDRHLLNILVSTKDGSLTGIDFGYVFGASTRSLAVPEIIPFRLTPHLVSLMSPMGTSGVIFKCMTHALRVFRNSEKILMTCMDVFVREPTINWLDLPKKEISEDDSDVSSNWEPKDRLDVARCKLRGYNPLHLLERELKSGVIARNSEYLEGYLTILRGRHQFNIRCRLPDKDLTVEEQVKSLIDIATDPGILGVTFHGFMPWM